MKNKIRTFLACVGTIVMSSCTGWLDVPNNDMISPDGFLDTDAEIEAYIAGLYDDLPIEDFMYYFSTGEFRFTGNLGGLINADLTRDCIHSEWGNFHSEDGNANQYWERGYEYIHKINQLKADISRMQPSDPAMLDYIKGESHFFTAYAYFQLAKRYGGVSLVKSLQEFDGDYEAVKVPRSTERATWDYILDECNQAIALLPEENFGNRATKWAALALKSRAMLFAASVAKFWNNAPLTGDAVSQKLVGGMDQEDQTRYYQACIDASAEIIRSRQFSLYRPEPGSREAATENYRTIFSDPDAASCEVIFKKSYVYPGIAHSMGAWHEPNQLSRQYGGRADPTLEFVDAYEVMDEDGNGSFDSKLKTRISGNENYNGYNPSDYSDYIHYDNPLDIFKDKDPRLAATVILPFSTWKNTEIIIQGGIVKEDRTAIWLSNESYVKDGQTYYGKGAANEAQFSGWVTALSNGTITGFLLKKFLSDGDDQNQNQVTTPYIDFRYAEILLNYAEAVAESGLPEPGDIIDAKTALNMTRKRAGFTNEIEVTPDNVQRERRVELGLEQTRSWDDIRRRRTHTEFDGAYQRCALVPMLDLSGDTPSYIFVRSTINEAAGPKRFREMHYYRSIPGIANNSVVQNPQW